MTSPPPPDTPRREAITTAEALTMALNGVSTRLDQVKQDSEERDEELRRYGRKNRVLIWLAVIGFTLDVAATVIAGYAVAQEHHQQVEAQHNAATISQLHELNVEACQAGNARLIKQQKALDAILTVGGTPKSPPAREFIARAEGFVASGWKARDCQVVYALPPGR